jgi:hypothetical protein
LDAIHAGTRAQKANLSRVIARMRGAGVTTVLIPLLEDEDGRARSAAAETLGRIAGLVGETPPGELDALKAWWQARRGQFVEAMS